MQTAIHHAEHGPGAGSPVRRLLVLYNPHLAAARTLLDALLKHLARTDVVTTSGSVRDVGFIESAVPGHDAVLPMGGDGSILRAARVASRHDIAVLGVNFGKVGFLSEVRPEKLFDVLPRLLSGDYWIEHRTMVQVELHRGTTLLGTYDALNEVVVARRTLSRVIRVHTFLNDQFLTTYVADGVIVATATGSTAYALAAGGPILHPEVRTLVLQPICPHLTISAALVLPTTTTVRLEVSTSHEATISIDGQVDGTLGDGDIVTVIPSPRSGLFLRLRPRDYFYENLFDRLHTSMHTP
ncbi:MAG: NAD(+)/NADH kinase [Chloroflexota bacterium]